MPQLMSTSEIEFSAECKKCLALAKSECLRLGDDVQFTQHLLLALLQSTALERLKLAGIDQTLYATRLEARLAAARLPRESYHLLGLPGCQTPRVKVAIERSMRRASAESRPVEVRDIWFGLLNDPECSTVGWLAEQGHRAEDLLRLLA